MAAEQIQGAVRTDPGRRPLGANEHDRSIGLHDQVQEERCLVQTGGTVGNDDAGQIRTLTKRIVDTARQLKPMRGRDVRAGNI